MKIAYFACFAGASGDMILGSLMDAGLPLETLKSELAKLGLDNFDLQVKKVLKKGIGGSQAVVIIDGISEGQGIFHDHPHDDSGHGHHYEHEHQFCHGRPHVHHHNHVHDHSSHPHRRLSDIRKIIENSGLNTEVRQKSMEIFERLAHAEARVHLTDIEEVHFHEVGAMDTIIDVVGAVAGLTALGIEKVFCSPLHTGCGTVTCHHGVLPVPAPATAELLKGKPVYSTGVKGELLTPTGAAILTTLSSDFGPMPAMTVHEIGYGAGTSDPEIPNLLRVSIGEMQEGIRDYETEQIALMETNIDDMNPQMYDYLIQKMLEMGAMDVFLTPVQMKKNRPGTLLTVLCAMEDIGRFADFLLQETTSIGLRWRAENRIKARRNIRTVSTRFGTVRIKIAETCGGEIINITPEYEDCRQIAAEKNIPLKNVMEDVRAETAKQFTKT